MADFRGRKRRKQSTAFGPDSDSAEYSDDLVRNGLIIQLGAGRLHPHRKLLGVKNSSNFFVGQIVCGLAGNGTDSSGVQY